MLSDKTYVVRVVAYLRHVVGIPLGMHFLASIYPRVWKHSQGRLKESQHEREAEKEDLRCPPSQL
jgi:hypothetical protein